MHKDLTALIYECATVEVGSENGNNLLKGDPFEPTCWKKRVLNNVRYLILPLVLIFPRIWIGMSRQVKSKSRKEKTIASNQLVKSGMQYE